MLRNLSLAFCMVVLLSTFGFAQNRVAQETDPTKVHVFFTLSEGSSGNSLNTFETNGNGVAIGELNNYGQHWFEEALTINTFDESYLVGSFAWDSAWGSVSVNGLPWNGGTQWQHDTTADGSYFWDLGWGIPQFISTAVGWPKYWSVDNDWENDGQIFSVYQFSDGWWDTNRWNAGLCRYSGSFDNNMKYASTSNLQDTVQTIVQTPFLSNINLAADVKVWGDSVYNTRGYSAAVDGVWKIRKNFVQDEGQELFIDGGNYGETAGQDFYGITFDVNNHIYVSLSGGNIIQFDMTSKAVTKVFQPSAGAEDIMVAGNLLYAGTSQGVKVFDITTAGSPVTTLANSFHDGEFIKNLDVIKDPATWGPSTEDFVCNVTLVDWNGASLPTVTVTVDAGTPEVKTLTGSGSSGSFTLSLSPGSHTIKVKAAKSLSQTQTGSTPQAFMLQCGDTNDDNKIDDLDFLSVIGNFGSTDPVLKLIGDGNGDDKTDDLDFLNVIGKFGTSGT